MSNSSSNKGKHLTLEDRIYIENALDEKYSLKEIATKLRKDPTTISKEVKRNRIISSRKGQQELITCHNRKDCKRKHICSDTCNRLCKKCTKLNCYRNCPDYWAGWAGGWAGTVNIFSSSPKVFLSRYC